MITISYSTLIKFQNKHLIFLEVSKVYNNIKCKTMIIQMSSLKTINASKNKKS